MAQAAMGVTRAFTIFTNAPKRRASLCIVFTFIVLLFTIVIYSSAIVDGWVQVWEANGSKVPYVYLIRLPREDEMEERLGDMQSHLLFLDSLYRTRQESVIALEAKLDGRNITNNIGKTTKKEQGATLSPHIIALIKNLTGSRAASGIRTKNLNLFQTPFVYHLLPHLLNNSNSLIPAYHMRSDRLFAEVVIGIPTVKRDKESYLMICLTHLISGLTPADLNTTLIIVMVGETDLEYVINVARQIEAMFPKQVDNGLIEVISPSASYYPNFDSLPLTLGDSAKRVKWRTKQNLDAIYLMAYAQTKGTFYLMLEDDVIAKRNYMQEIKHFAAAITVTTPNWFFLNFCHVGGIGKLFRSSDLLRFVNYVQLFYNNMPIDWLLESYLADRVCTIDKTSNNCARSKKLIRPEYKTSLFRHIGLYSSLKGKIQKVKDPNFGIMPTFYPHDNPPISRVYCSIVENSDHTALRAYKGETFFWGVKPKKNDVIEFWFAKPTNISSFLFRSGNQQHMSDKFSETVVEVLPVNRNNSTNFTIVDSFDEFGLADGDLPASIGSLRAIRIRVNKDSQYWCLLSEIDLRLEELGAS